jgi:hypothetical protein
MTAVGGAPRRGLIVFALFAATLTVGALALPSLGDMSDHGVGIVDLELTRTAAKASGYYAELGEKGRDAARTSLYLDYPYLVLYGLFWAAACIVVAARAAERGMSRLARLGRPFAIGALVAAGCDAIENAALLRLLAGHTGQPWPAIAFTAASLKFALVIAAALFAIVGFLLTLRPSRRPQAIGER